MTSEDWRGSPTATKKHEFRKLLKNLKFKKKDIYYELGCGYGAICRLLSKKVKKVVGIENSKFRYKKAVRLTPASRYPNITYLRRNFFTLSFKEASLIYCTQELSFTDFIWLQKKTKLGTKIIVPELPPPYPIKSKRVWPFFVVQTPFKKVKNENEYASIYFGEKTTIEEMLDELTRDIAKSLKFQISRSESNWKKLRKS